MKRCSHCGSANHDKSKQCWSCKTPLDDENTNTSMGRLNQPRNKRKTKGLDTIIVVLIAFVLFLGLGYFTTLTNNTNINSAPAITVDTSNLRKILTEAKGIKTDGYTPASIDTLNNAIKKAELTINNEASVDEVANAEFALNQAINGMELIPDKTELSKLLDEALLINTDTYSKFHKQCLKIQIEAATKVIENQNATSRDISNAMTLIEQAADNFQNSPEKKELVYVYAEAIEADYSKYDLFYLELLISRTQKAEDIIYNINATSKEIVDMVTCLKKAITYSGLISQQSQKLNGRGYSDESRNEPQYVGVMGYVVIPVGMSILFQMEDSFPDAPWNIPKYQQDKQFYVKCGFVEHKTKVKVIEQNLIHQGYGNYTGMLKVKQLDTDEEYFVDVNTFITKDYWNYNSVKEAIKVGDCIGIYNQVSNYWPMTKNNKRVEIDNGTKVVIIANANNSPNAIEGIVYKQWEYGYGGVSVYFNESDLKIIY